MCSSFAVSLLLLVTGFPFKGADIDLGEVIPTISISSPSIDASQLCPDDKLFNVLEGDFQSFLNKILSSLRTSRPSFAVCDGELICKDSDWAVCWIDVKCIYLNESSGPKVGRRECFILSNSSSFSQSSSSCSVWVSIRFGNEVEVNMSLPYWIPANASVKFSQKEKTPETTAIPSAAELNCTVTPTSVTSPMHISTTPEAASTNAESNTSTKPSPSTTWSEGSAVQSTSLGHSTADTTVSTSGYTTLYDTTSGPAVGNSSCDGVNSTTPSSSLVSESSSLTTTATTTTSPTTTTVVSMTASTTSMTITSSLTTSPPTSISMTSSSSLSSASSASMSTTASTALSTPSTTSSTIASLSATSTPTTSTSSLTSTSTSSSSSSTSSSSSATLSTSSSSSSSSTTSTMASTSSSPSSSSSSSTTASTTTISKMRSTPSSLSSSPSFSSSTSTTTANTTTPSTTTSQTDAATTSPLPFIVRIKPIRLTNGIYNDSLKDNRTAYYIGLWKDVYRRLFNICQPVFQSDFINVSLIEFSPGSVIVDAALEFNRNLTDGDRDKLNNAIQNGFSPQNGIKTPTDIVAVVVGCVVGFLFIFICILIVIFFVRWRHKKRQRRLRPEPAEPEPEVAGGAFPLQRPQTLLWQSSVATSSLSRRGGESSIIELSVHGLEGGESYVGTDDGSGPKRHLADTIRAKNGIRDPALRHHGDATSDAGLRPGRLNDVKGAAAGQMWNGAIPRPELDKTRFYQLRQHEDSVFALKDGKSKVANGYKVKWGQGWGKPEEMGARKKREEEELGNYNVERRGGGLGGLQAGGLGAGGLGAGGLRAGGLRAGGLGAGGLGAGGLGAGGVDINIWETSDSGTSGSDQATSNHMPSPLFPDDPSIFSGRAPVFQVNHAPSPFDRSLPRPASAGAERGEQRIPATFEGLFVPTMTFGRHSESSGGSSTRHLLPPLEARTTGAEGGLHQPGRTPAEAGQGESTFDDASLSEVLTLHGAKQKLQSGILSRLQGSLSRAKTKPDNIHRTPTRNQTKTRPQLSPANGAENGMC